MSAVVAILGGGAGGCSAAVDLGAAGHIVQLWNRRAESLGALLDGGALHHDGVLGTGTFRPALVTTELGRALAGAQVAVLCQPALAHEAVLGELAALGWDQPIVLNPGHTCGALHARAVFAARGRELPPVAELSTLTYVARKPAPDSVSVYGKAGRVHAAALPGGADALRIAAELFPAASPAADVIATSLANVNLVLHPPGAVLGASWIEATGGDFTFYVEGMTDGVVRAVTELDAERLAVARAYGHTLPPLLEEMAAIGTVEPGAAGAGPAIRGARANAAIKAPGSLAHRYFREDLPYGLVPFLGLAELAGVSVPLARALLALGEVVTGEQFGADGLNLARLGLAGRSIEDVLALVRQGGT